MKHDIYTKINDLVDAIPLTDTSPSDARAVIMGTRSKAFAPGAGQVQDARSDIDSDTISLSVTQTELLEISLGLLLLQQSREAERYIKQSLGTGITSEQRYTKAAEIMLLKMPGEKPAKHGDDEFHYYHAIMSSQRTTSKKAVELVCNRYDFSKGKPYQTLDETDQARAHEACAKWLCDEITKRKKEFPDLYQDLKKPSKSFFRDI